MRDLTLENPIRAIREICHDMTGRRKVRLANGREASALDIQEEYLNKARDFVDRRELDDAADRRGRSTCGSAPSRRSSPSDLEPGRARDRLGDQVQADRALPRPARPAAEPPADRPARPRLPRHPPRPRALLPAREARRGRPGRPTTCAIFEAKSVPPQTTRARLRGEFIKRAQERRRDFTVDWVHLKLNDQAQRTVLCKDPFRSARRAGREAHRGHVTPPHQAPSERRSQDARLSWPGRSSHSP